MKHYHDMICELKNISIIAFFTRSIDGIAHRKQLVELSSEQILNDIVFVFVVFEKL